MTDSGDEMPRARKRAGLMGKYLKLSRLKNLKQMQWTVEREQQADKGGYSDEDKYLWAPAAGSG